MKSVVLDTIGPGFDFEAISDQRSVLSRGGVVATPFLANISNTRVHDGCCDEQRRDQKDHDALHRWSVC